MIVFDASTLVGVTIRLDSTPDRALRHALQNDLVAMSVPIMAELLDVLFRERLQRFVNPDLRTTLLLTLGALAQNFDPTDRLKDCRDDKDHKYLELAVAAGATIIVSSDNDLLTLHPWRGIQILTPAEYLARSNALP